MPFLVLLIIFSSSRVIEKLVLIISKTSKLNKRKHITIIRHGHGNTAQTYHQVAVGDVGKYFWHSANPHKHTFVPAESPILDRTGP
jgi:hypothetical protein